MNIVQPAVSGGTAELTVDGQRITWKSDRDFATSNDNFALLASLPLAMVKGGHLHVAGAVNPRLIRNAILIGHYWAQWRPDLYRPFVVSADRKIDDGPAVSANAVICLSGGVDSTYAYLSSVHDARPAMRLPVGAGIFVRGFDYSLQDVEGYDRNRRSISAMAEELPVHEVATDWRSRLCGPGRSDWRHVHALGLAATLHLFSSSFGRGIIGSDSTFREDHVFAPWSSNAATNRMLGSTGFDVVPVGEDLSRIDKIGAIDGWGKLSFVNVCWQGPRTGRNCARCRKCLRTMLQCEALGIDPSPAFGRRPSPKDMETMDFSTPARAARLARVLNRPDNQFSPALKAACRRALRKAAVKRNVKPWASWVRKLLVGPRAWA